MSSALEMGADAFRELRIGKAVDVLPVPAEVLDLPLELLRDPGELHHHVTGARQPRRGSRGGIARPSHPRGVEAGDLLARDVALHDVVVEGREAQRGDGYDQLHAVMASVTDVFMTRDERLAEHLRRVPVDGFRVVTSLPELMDGLVLTECRDLSTTSAMATGSGNGFWSEKAKKRGNPRRERWWLQRDSNPCFSLDHVLAKPFTHLQRNGTPNIRRDQNPQREVP
jgi:hypothetical protein